MNTQRKREALSLLLELARKEYKDTKTQAGLIRAANAIEYAQEELENTQPNTGEK